jgi:hypothetical protein
MGANSRLSRAILRGLIIDGAIWSLKELKVRIQKCREKKRNRDERRKRKKEAEE